MRLPHRKSRLERLAEPVTDALSVPKPVKSLAKAEVAKAGKAGMTVFGGLAGAAAASAVVSSLRRRSQGGS